MSSSQRTTVRERTAQHVENRAHYTSLLVDSVEAPQNFLPYLRLCWEHRNFLFRVGVRTLLASTLIAFLVPARYESVTRLMPPDGQSSAGLGMLAALTGRGSTVGGLGGFSGLAGDLLGMKNSSGLFVGIIGSQTVQDRLINEFQLQKVYHDSKVEDARKDLNGYTSVSDDRKSGIITIAVTDHDPKRATAMARAYVDELDRLVAQVSTSSARRERVFLEERLQKVKVDLDSAARNFSDFASKNTAIDIPAQGRAMVEAAAILQGQLIAAQSEASGLRQIYTDHNVRVRAAEARINELEQKLNEIGGAGSQNDLKRENSLYPSIRKLPLLGVPYADLYRQTKIQETVYELLTQQYELAKVQEAKEIPTVKVLDPAIVPTKKSFPPRSLIMTLGAMLGIVLAIAWIVGKSRWDALGINDQRKLFAGEVFTTLQERFSKFSLNGRADANGTRIGLFSKKPKAEGEDDEDGLQVR